MAGDQRRLSKVNKETQQQRWWWRGKAVLMGEIQRMLIKTRCVRNVTGNLAWTEPCKCTNLQKDCILETVDNFAWDTFCVQPPADNAAAGSVAPPVGDDDDDYGIVPELVKSKKRVWNIPNAVPTSFVIPISLRSANEPTKGKWERIGSDIAVFGTWLAYWWALQEGSTDAKGKLERLIINWPFDLFLYEQGKPDAEGTIVSDVEQSILTKMIKLPLAVEHARDYLGMDGSNLLNVVNEAKEMVKLLGTVVGERDYSVAVHTWLIRPDLPWGMARTPTLRMCKDMLRINDRLQAHPQIRDIAHQARARYGRDNFLT